MRNSYLQSFEMAKRLTEQQGEYVNEILQLQIPHCWTLSYTSCTSAVMTSCNKHPSQSAAQHLCRSKFSEQPCMHYTLCTANCPHCSLVKLVLQGLLRSSMYKIELQTQCWPPCKYTIQNRGSYRETRRNAYVPRYVHSHTASSKCKI